MRKRLIGCVLVAFGLAFAIPSSAAGSVSQIGLARINLTTVATGLSRPIAFAWRNGDASKIYVAEQTGRVAIVSGGPVTGTVLPLTGLATGGEQGLLGIAFSNAGTKLYVDYTDTTGDIHIVEYTMNGNIANLSTRRQLLVVQHHLAANHNGGNLVIGADNLLYISTRDRCPPANPSPTAHTP